MHAYVPTVDTPTERYLEIVKICIAFVTATVFFVVFSDLIAVQSAYAWFGFRRFHFFADFFPIYIFFLSGLVPPPISSKNILNVHQ